MLTASTPPLLCFRHGDHWRWQAEAAWSRALTDRTELDDLLNQAEDWTRSGRPLAGLLHYEAGPLLETDWAWPDAARPWLEVWGFEHWQESSTLPDPLPDRWQVTAPFRPQQSRDEYLARCRTVQDLLRAGDCYQINLTQRFDSHWEGEPWQGWLALMARHAAPHSVWLNRPQGAVLSASPERLLQVQERRLATEPIKGSRPRGSTPEQDRALADDLCGSLKDRAENLMIVDLLRNDLGRICVPGSIRVDPLFELRRFSNVQHLVSTVQGQRRQDLSALEALLACFPGGSITGAPKRRAMEIIRELEPVPRQAYCGSFFWQDRSDHLDANILIRTFQIEQDRLYCHGGGGIVIDSVPELEYEESRFKVQALMEALGATLAADSHD